MFRADDEHEPVASIWDYLDLRLWFWIGDYAHINLMVYHVIINFVWPTILYMNVDLRIALDELLNHRRQFVKPDRVNCRDADLPADHIAKAFNLFSQ